MPWWFLALEVLNVLLDQLECMSSTQTSMPAHSTQVSDEVYNSQLIYTNVHVLHKVQINRKVYTCKYITCYIKWSKDTHTVKLYNHVQSNHTRAQKLYQRNIAWFWQPQIVECMYLNEIFQCQPWGWCVLRYLCSYPCTTIEGSENEHQYLTCLHSPYQACPEYSAANNTTE